MSREEVFKVILDLAKDHLGPLIMAVTRRNHHPRYNRPPEEELFNVTIRPGDIEQLQTFFPEDIIRSIQGLTTLNDELVITVTRRAKRPVRLKQRDEPTL